MSRSSPIRKTIAEILAELSRQRRRRPAWRCARNLAAKAFARTAAYDAAIAGWFAQSLDIAAPRHFAIGGRLAEELRYGENPHQKAALLSSPASPARRGHRTAAAGQATVVQQHQRHRRRLRARREFDPARSAAVAIIKHANPCGVATGADARARPIDRALACDPVSAFGGIIALNRELDAAGRARRSSRSSPR